jgi:Sigma-70, region 4
MWIERRYFATAPLVERSVFFVSGDAAVLAPADEISATAATTAPPKPISLLTCTGPLSPRAAGSGEPGRKFQRETKRTRRPRLDLGFLQRAHAGAAEVTLREETVRKILGTLPSRQRAVLELRYGFNGEHPRTLDEIGRTFNVTRERIRQIENQSLRKLETLARAEKLNHDV